MIIPTPLPKTQIHEIWMFMARDDKSDNLVLWLFDGVTVGKHEDIITQVNQGDIIIWRRPEGSGIYEVAVRGDGSVERQVFDAPPATFRGHPDVFQATIKEDATGDYHYNILVNGIFFDPKIRVLANVLARNSRKEKHSTLAKA
ncbi:MAG: hypothetical protein JNM68_13495 [Dinghuibacter sp.]|nr:hypothetical protein [Dinghuibacter sp.]